MPYNPKSVLRQVPNGIIQQYFSRHFEFATFDWASVKETRIDPVFETWQRMPEDRRKQASGVIHRVYALANPRGTAVLVKAHIATLPRRSWEKRNGMPKQAIDINDDVVDALGRSLSAYYYCVTK